jgi:hypothetical protein
MFNKRTQYAVTNGINFGVAVLIFSFIFWFVLFAFVGVFQAKTWIDAYLYVAKLMVIAVAIVVIWTVMDVITDWLVEKAHANHR